MQVLAGVIAAFAISVSASPAGPTYKATVSQNGVFPNIVFSAESTPERSEAGIGAMMAWADKLYVISYLSVPSAGNGTYLASINRGMDMTIERYHSSCYANRMIHPGSQQMFIGPFAVDGEGNIRTIEALLNTVRLGAMALDVEDPDNSVLMVSMDGPLYRVNTQTLEAVKLFDLAQTLDMKEQPHFKAAWTVDGVFYVGANTWDEADFVEQPNMHHGGRFASWEGGMSKDNWTIISTDSTVEITSRFNFGKVLFVLQLDDASVILRVKDLGDGADKSYDKDWQIYRLPRATSTQNHLWSCEWPRIREIITERYLMNGYGLLYELSALGYDGAVWGVKPISQTLRIIPDWTQFAGFLVLGSNQNSPIFDNNLVTSQAQSGLLFTYEDALWDFGKPQGWGGPWRYDVVQAEEASDAYLMTGFDKKMAHFRCDDVRAPDGTVLHSVEATGGANFTIQVDFLGQSGHLETPWNDYITLAVPAGGYAYHTFPSGFSAHWVRVVSSAPCNATAWFTYT